MYLLMLIVNRVNETFLKRKLIEDHGCYGNFVMPPTHLFHFEAFVLYMVGARFFPFFSLLFPVCSPSPMRASLARVVVRSFSLCTSIRFFFAFLTQLLFVSSCPISWRSEPYQGREEGKEYKKERERERERESEL